MPIKLKLLELCFILKNYFSYCRKIDIIDIYFYINLGVGNLKRILITIFIILLILVTSGGFLAWKYALHRYGKTINYTNVYFILKSDSSLDSVAQQLEDKKVIRSGQFLIKYLKIVGVNVEKIPSGNYILKPGTPLNELIEKLKSGKPDFAIVTIPEGYTLYQIAERLENNGLVNKDEFINSNLQGIDTDKLLTNSEDTFYPMEGYLFPDTYYIPYSASKEHILQLMFGDFSRVFSDKYRERTKELGLTVEQVITIASLIEKEAANDAERSRIAGVIYNRLKRDMPLQIDAAVIYANTKGQSSLSKVTSTHLKYDSKYNTYLYKGLPPGPIASPGKPSIEAALYPESHDFLYYVAAENGHVFSKTYEEHLQNVKKYIK